MIRAKEEVSTRASPTGDWSKGSTVGWYFGIVQGSGKIPYTCNYLFLINGFLGVMTWNSPGEVFSLQKVFLIRQQITMSFNFLYA